MPEPVHVMPKRTMRDPESDPHLNEEWLVTNGLGGYASGTVSGAITRRYHGLLIAALPNPLGRMMMLNALSERFRLADRRMFYTGAEELTGHSRAETLAVAEFRLEAGLPVWRYEFDGIVLEKRLVMPYRQNTVHVTYQLLAGAGTVRLGLRPAVHFRSHDAAVSAGDHQKYVLTVCEDRYEISVGSGSSRAPLAGGRQLPGIYLRSQAHSVRLLSDRAQSGIRRPWLTVESRDIFASILPRGRRPRWWRRPRTGTPSPR